MVKKLIVQKRDPKRDLYIGLEFDLADEADDQTIVKTFIRMRALVEQELGAPSDIGNIPELDIAEIEALPWKKKIGVPAPKGFGWLFGPGSRDGTEEGAAKLVDAIKGVKDGKIVLGDMEYSLSADEVFIQRKPIKKESAKMT